MSDSQCLVATVLGSIPSSSDTVESEGAADEAVLNIVHKDRSTVPYRSILTPVFVSLELSFLVVIRIVFREEGQLRKAMARQCVTRTPDRYKILRSYKLVKIFLVLFCNQ